MEDVFDYIVVGAGAGGGPLAVRLAEAGNSVLLLDAGGEPSGDVYDCPAFHGVASQNPDWRWDYWVQHYQDRQQQRRDTKYRHSVPTHDAISAGLIPCGDINQEKIVNGVLYPRAAGLGGCTAHHAMISVYPHKRDWEKLEAMTGDHEWSSQKMRRRLSSKLQADQRFESEGASHGSFGEPSAKDWLATQLPDLNLLTSDPSLLAIMTSAVTEWVKNHGVSKSVRDALSTILTGTFRSGVQGLSKDQYLALISALDPNHAGGIETGEEGIYLVPLSTKNRKRVGSRDAIKQGLAKYPERLKVITNAMVHRLQLVKQPTGQYRATGVEFKIGFHLFEGDPFTSEQFRRDVIAKTAEARREVILCAGTFNSPQILMQSGIGPVDELQAHGINVKVPSEGVGKNLHDRYEVAVINRMKDSFSVWNDNFLDPSIPDAAMKEWRERGTGLYTTSGATIAFVRKSDPSLTEADLFIFGTPVYFKGYYPDYHADALTVGRGTRNPRAFTWAILKKAPTTGRQHRGQVKVKCKAAMLSPEVNFNYFPNGPNDSDAAALASAVREIRGFSAEGTRANQLVEHEIQPGKNNVSDIDLHQWVRDEAWGHHACGTCRIGRDDQKEALQGWSPAVLDSQFRVRNVDRLRVVDASAFPDIPGFFISTAIYMLAEKAADDILSGR